MKKTGWARLPKPTIQSYEKHNNMSNNTSTKYYSSWWRVIQETRYTYNTRIREKKNHKAQKKSVRVMKSNTKSFLFFTTFHLLLPNPHSRQFFYQQKGICEVPVWIVFSPSLDASWIATYTYRTRYSPCQREVFGCTSYSRKHAIWRGRNEGQEIPRQKWCVL